MKKSVVALVLVVALVALVGVMFVVSSDVDRPDDSRLVLDEATVPDESNGYVMLMSALDAMEWPEDDAWVFATSRPETSRSPEILALIERNREALRLMTRAVDAPHFRAPPSTDLEDLPLVEDARKLGHLVAIDATVRVLSGDIGGALERHFRYLDLTHRLKSTGELLHYLVGSAYQEEALKQVVRMAGDTSRRDASVLERYARQLEHYRWDRASMENALRREYMFMTSMVDDPSIHEGWRKVPLLGSYVYHPNRTRALYVDSYEAAFLRLNDDCSIASRTSPKTEMPKWRFVGPNGIGRFFYHLSVPDFDRFTYTRCRDRMVIGMTQLVLATRAYRARTGALPAELDALVPDYLDALPVDLDGQSFRYSLVDEYLYSVGENRLEEGGGEALLAIDWYAADPIVSLRR